MPRLPRCAQGTSTSGFDSLPAIIGHRRRPANSAAETQGGSAGFAALRLLLENHNQGRCMVFHLFALVFALGVLVVVIVARIGEPRDPGQLPRGRADVDRSRQYWG